MAISDDGGFTWKGSEPIVGRGGIQPSVVRKNDGTLVAYLRDNGPAPKRALMSVSTDDGESWTTARDTDILNPGSSVEVVRLHERPLDHGPQRSRAGPVLARRGHLGG